MSRILALDYGAKRVGVAVTDPLQIIATSLDTIPTDKLLDFLKKYMSQEVVSEIVMGYPTRLNNEDTHATPLVREFVKVLEKEFPTIPVYLEDERFTSKMAVQTMIDGGMKKKDRRVKGNIDKLSATIILQSYMESKNR